MGTRFDYERRDPCMDPVATKGAEGIGAVDCKDPGVPGSVLAKGVEGWRMPAWSAADWSRVWGPSDCHGKDPWWRTERNRPIGNPEWKQGLRRGLAC